MGLQCALHIIGSLLPLCFVASSFTSKQLLGTSNFLNSFYFNSHCLQPVYLLKQLHDSTQQIKEHSILEDIPSLEEVCDYTYENKNQNYVYTVEETEIQRCDVTLPGLNN